MLDETGWPWTLDEEAPGPTINGKPVTPEEIKQISDAHFLTMTEAHLTLLQDAMAEIRKGYPIINYALPDRRGESYELAKILEETAREKGTIE